MEILKEGEAGCDLSNAHSGEGSGVALALRCSAQALGLHHAAQIEQSLLEQLVDYNKIEFSGLLHL